MAERIRRHDWAATPLGPIETWPQSLKTAADLMLASPQPVYIAWGRDLISLYNEGYVPNLETKHPKGLGQFYAQLFAEIWDEYSSIAESTMAGKAYHFVDHPVPLAGRNGLPISWFTFSWTPLRDHSGTIAGFYCLATETTERALAEHALRENEKRFRAFVTASSKVVYRMSPDWTQMRQLDGRGSLSDMAGTRRGWMEDHIHPDDQPMVRSAIEKAILARGHFELEHRVRRADGAFGWILSRAVPILDEHGEITEWLGAASDITARKKAEDALRESEERQAFLLELSDALRSLANAIEIKAAAARLLGEQLGVNRAFYADADDDHWLVTKGYEEGIEPLPDVPFALAKYGQWIIEDFRAGRRLVVRDMGADARFHGSERAAQQALQIAATVAVPLVKGSALVAMLVVHGIAPRDWTKHELALVDETAERTWAAVERARAEAAQRQSEARLAVDLADTRRLHRISSSLIVEDNVDALYDEVLEAARWLMRSEMASIQRLVPERQQFFLIAQHGFAPESAKFWEWVRADDTTSCGVAFARGEPIVVPDIEVWDFIAGDKTVRSSADLPDFRHRFRDRLNALARVQGLLWRLNEHDRVTFDELVRTELAAMNGSSERVTLNGPTGVRLRSSTVQTLAVALHELATNAIKYGALGQPAGRLDVSWSLEPSGSRGKPWLHIVWRESGVAMPQAGSAPRGTGQGRELIEQALPYQLSAETSYRFETDGVHRAISIPVSASLVEENEYV